MNQLALMSLCRRMPNAWPWIKDALAGVCFVFFVVSVMYGLDVVVAALQANGVLE